MKKHLAILMTIIFCISMFAGISVSAFSDVDADHRHSQAIDFLAGKGVINGYEDGSFKPEDTITRAEFVKMMLEFLGFGNIYGDAIVNTNFTDVDGKNMTITSKDEEGNETTTNTTTNQHWAAGYIKLAVDKGVVNGYGDGTFGPDDPVKYEEAIKMIVCCLGREEHAKTRAEIVNMPLWPDGYLSIGNDLMVGKSTDYVLGTNAGRSNVAQMLYNVKDVQIYVAPTINIEGITGSVGGFGGGADGGVSNSTTVVTDLVAYGQVVAAVKDPADTKKQIIIDDGIVIDEQPVASVHSKYVILKLENPIDGNDYEQFYTHGEDFSSYVGQRVELKYSYNPDGGVTGRYEISSMSAKDTDVVYIDAKNFKREKTTQKNLQTSILHICYTDGERDYEQCLYTEDLNELTIIYNNKLVNTETHPLTLSDLMPEVGSIGIIDAYQDSSIDVVWVNTYETYVVGSRSFSTTPKRITDKFRTVDESPTPLELEINDTDPAAIINIKQNGQEIETTAIPQNAILTVTKSKCGTNLDITVERPTTSTKTLKSVRTENGVKKSFTMSDNVEYTLSDYYINYVDDTLEYENGDNLTLYLNSRNEVIWASVAEVAYSMGYLISASYSESTEKLTLKILTSSGAITTFTMSPTRTRYITKATNALSSVTPNSITNPNGYMYKNLNEHLILASLQENANKINYGADGTEDDKPSSVLTNAGTAQPIMYAIATSTEIYTLVTLEPDMTNRYVNESLKYDIVSGNHKFFNEDSSKTFSVPTDATVIFVPNDRTGWGANAFKIGKISSLSTKLIEYMSYNIEPFYTTDVNGNPKRSMFVVYNQNIDSIPNYRSDNIIVTSIGETLSGSSVNYQLKGYVASTSTIKTYNAYMSSYWEKNEETGAGGAYVLDENFERLPGVRRTVEAGDVVRLGFGPTGTVACVEIILDASEEFKSGAPKETAVSKYSSALDISAEGFEDMVYYYARIGEVTAIDSSVVPEWCKIRLDDGSLSQVYIGTGYSAKQILLYDYSETNVNNRIKKITMDSILEGDMLYVWQGENGTFKQIYAIRY